MEGQPFFSIGHLRTVDHLILGLADHLLESGSALLDLSRLDTFACNSWSQVADSLTQGKINGAFMAIPMALDLFANGLDIRLLMFTHRKGGMVLKKRSPRIKQIKDFRGKSVLIPSRFSVEHMLLHRMLSSAGLTIGSPLDPSADLYTETISPCLMPRMIQQDKDDDIAGFAVADPFGIQAIAQGSAVQICRTGSLWDNHPGCAFILHNDMIRNHPDAVAQLIDLFMQAAQQLCTRMSDCLPSFAPRFLDLPADMIRHLTANTDTCFGPALLFPDAARITVIQDYMADTMNILEHKIDIDHFIDASFINMERWGTGLEN